jgi:integrase/recombinase XerD
MALHKNAKKPDIHNYQKKLDNSLAKLDASKVLSQSQKDDIREFIETLRDEGLSVPRIHKYVYTISFYGEWLGKDFGEVGADDILKAVREHVDRNDNISPATKYHYKVALRKFFKWYCGRDKPPDMREYPEMVRWIKPKSVDNETKLPEEILSEGDIKKLLDTDSHIRNKAIIAVLFNSGARVGEFLTLKLRHVEIDKFGASITLWTSKTQSRKVRLGFAAPYLIGWCNVHPFRDDLEAALWVPFNAGGVRGRDRDAISYQNLVKILSGTAIEAGVRKAMNPHALRHAAATFDAKCGMPEAMMRQKFGWGSNSKMPSLYIHLAGKDMEDFELKRAGLKVAREKPGEAMRPLQCPRCELINKATCNYCDKCGLPLNNIAAMRLDEIKKSTDVDMDAILRDPDVEAVISRKVREIIERECEVRG